MKKTVTVSLGGIVFCLEEDAYHALDAYLKRLETSFYGEEDRREIMNDIEDRIAEHLREKALNPEMVVSLNDVSRVIMLMGDPSDFGTQSDANKRTTSSYSDSRKRLYRDPENRVLGGVCSGLSYYWNIDPVIIRVLFVITAFWGGGGVFVYIILWIVIPEALTVSQRLEMTGEPVTAENIGRSFQESKEHKKS